MFTWTCDRSSKMDVSVSAGDLLQIDGTLDESVLIGDKFLPPPRTKRYLHYLLPRHLEDHAAGHGGCMHAYHIISALHLTGNNITVTSLDLQIHLGI